MKDLTQKFNSWIKRHTLFAISAPIIVLLLGFFISSSISSIKNDNQNQTDKGAYNNFLPDQKKELKVIEPNDIYKKSQQDSLDALMQSGLFKSMLDAKKENDSLERILEELDNFSLDETAINGNQMVKPTMPTTTLYQSKKTNAQEKLAYRKLLMEARDERLSRSQDYSAPYTETINTSAVVPTKFEASIYRDQFILPGDRVILILNKEANVNGTRFPKNTFVYATANIQGTRLLLDVTNINNVRIPLIAMDQEDGMTGLYNQRAGVLLQEFKAAIQQQSMNQIAEEIGELNVPLAKNLTRAFGNFFTKKKYKQRDKILLVNGDRVRLIPKI